MTGCKVFFTGMSYTKQNLQLVTRICVERNQDVRTAQQITKKRLMFLKNKVTCKLDEKYCTDLLFGQLLFLPGRILGRILIPIILQFSALLFLDAGLCAPLHSLHGF